VSDDPVGRAPSTASGEASDGLDALTGEVLPALIARLRASRLAELEVRSDGWRVRLRRDRRATQTRAAADGSSVASDDARADLAGSVARSPAVGYFKPASELVVGHSVQNGDLLGTIDVLGIVQDVASPADGIVGRVLAEDGQAVEYGQALADIDPLELDLTFLDGASEAAD
jgi:biotin carboxyl carrier protein